MEDITFKSIRDLYNRLLPALKSKVKLIHKDGYLSIKENDIWDYMYNNRWFNEKGLTLYDMVSTIMHEDNKSIIEYKENKIK